MNQDREERRIKWPIRPSVISAFVLGLMVSYVLSAGPMSRVLATNQSGLYVGIYQPLYFITDRLPDSMFDAFERYIELFGDIPNLSFMASRDCNSGACNHCFDHVPFPVDKTDQTPSLQSR